MAPDRPVSNSLSTQHVSPARALICALLFSIVFFIGIVWHIWHSYADLQIARNDSKIQEQIGYLLKLNNLFQQANILAVESEDMTRWQEKYNVYMPELEQTLKRCAEASPQLFSSGSGSKVSGAAFIVMQQLNEVNRLITSGKYYFALGKLSNPHFIKYETLYTDGVHEIDRETKKSSRNVLEAQQGRAFYAVGFMLFAFPVLVLSWLGTIRSFRDRITHQAYYDALTGLPNRLLFHDRLSQAVMSARQRQKSVAILFLDLDRFNVINDTLGHHIGDLCLQAAADRLRGCINDFETVARLGGDQFLVVLKDLADISRAAQVATQILEILSRPFRIDQHELFITTSIGISMFPSDGTDFETLIKNSHSAMYRAKDQGRNCYQYFTEDLNAKSFKRMALENGLRKAITRDELRLFYQPQWDIQSGRIIGMEALIRWQHPDLGMVFPSAFIPVAEETGLIVDIGEWVLRTACKQNKAWLDAGYPELRVAVNLSGRQFQMQNLTQLVRSALDDTDLSSRFLELEITESMLMDNIQENIEILQELSQLGVHLCIDDFGTGYSSLSYLQRFAIDSLKIDRSFINEIQTNTDDAILTTAIIAMAHRLNLSVVAEGVETEQQLAFLKSHNCDTAQGYFFSRAVPPDEFAQLLEQGSVFKA